MPLQRNSSTKLIILNSFLAHKDSFLTAIRKVKGLRRLTYIYDMNFLSHFYFDSTTTNPYVVLGTVLPDLIKNTNKSWTAHPQKHEYLFVDDELKSILTGWKRHLEVDLIFHSSPYFFEKTKELKYQLLPILENSVVRPSFLAHIGLELLLDHLLIIHRKIKIDAFYDCLDEIDPSKLQDFLISCKIDDLDRFFKFFNNFKSSRYLLSYQQLGNISYALNRICMRIWEHPFNEQTTQQLTGVLELYKTQLEVDFMIIFDEIENRLP
jgi:acyl carrier protein phosphodiesterase